MSTYVFKAHGPRRAAKATRRGRGRVSKQVVSDQLKSRGLIVLDIADKHASQGAQRRAASSSVKADGPDGHDPPARHDGQLGHDDPARALRARGADREQAPQGDDRRGPQGRRGRPAALRRAGAPPQDLQPAVRRDDPRRRDRRHARRVADARRRPAREGRLAAPPGQVRDDLPGGRHHLRGRRADRAGRLPGAGLHRRLQAVRRRAAGDHEAHRRDVATRSPATGGPADRRSPSARRLASASGSAPSGAARSGTASACASR